MFRVMKRNPLLLIAGASLFGALLPLPAQNKTAAADPFVKNPGDPAAAVAQGAASWRHCLLVLEVYALDKNDALAVLETEHGSAARYRSVTELTKTGKARLEILTAVTTKSGLRAVIEAIDEVRYATEFEKPVAKGGIAAPTAYEKRDVGDTNEFEPTLSEDGRTCNLEVALQRMGLLGFRDIGAMAHDSAVSQPIFGARKLSTSMTFPANEAHFIGSLTRATGQGAANGGAASDLSLAFVRMSVSGPTAEEMKPPAKPMDWSALNLEYRIYSLDRAAAREILVAPPDLQAPWKSLQSLVAEKKARFEHLLSVQTKSGQRAVTEEVQEVRYASEYEPAARAEVVEKSQRTSTTESRKPEKQKADGQKPDAGEAAITTKTDETTTVTRPIANAETIPGKPSDFAVRRTGVTVEVEPTVGPDGLSIDLWHQVQSVTHLGDLKTTGLAARYPAQPVFERRQIASGQTLLAGRHMLIGTFNPPGADGVNDRTDDGRTWLIFVRATPNEP